MIFGEIASPVFSETAPLLKNPCGIMNTCKFRIKVQVTDGYKYKDLEQVYLLSGNFEI